MSVKSKNYDAKAPDRPFDKEVLAKARQVAERYQIVLKLEDGEWYGHGLELPGARGDGKTPVAAVADTREALVTMVAYMMEEGQAIPAPASEGNRSVQINIRVTPEEKTLLESRSRARGFRGLSDFIRTAVLEKV
jgi:predicted RNase H-like HicB family nuclease